MKKFCQINPKLVDYGKKFSPQKNDVMISRQETDHLITLMENNLPDGDRSALTPSLPALLEWEKP